MAPTRKAKPTAAAAIGLLSSRDSRKRLQAARVLAQYARPNHEAAIRKALATENVAWVRTALRVALDRIEGKAQTPVGALDGSAGSFEEGRERGIAETTRTFLHELEPLLGSLRLDAANELTDFAQSRTNRVLDRLDAFLESMLLFSKAGARPRLTHLDLAELIEEAVSEEKRRTPFSDRVVTLTGTRPFPIRSDGGLLRLAIANAVRNGLEASAAVSLEAPVTVTWGKSDREVWCAVLDEGGGPPAAAHLAFAIGSTGKRGHLGMGLAIAKRATVTLGGQILLSSREDRGACLEIRIPIEGESAR